MSANDDTMIQMAYALKTESERVWEQARTVENLRPSLGKYLFQHAKSLARECDLICEQHSDKCHE